MNRRAAQRRLLWVAIAVAAIVLFTFTRFCVNGCLSLDTLRYHRERIQDFVDNNYLLSMIIFWAMYVFENVFALPIAAVMTIGAGYFYGVIPAILLTIVSALCGALASFLLARFLVGGYVQNVYKEGLARFNRQFERNGAWYLLMVRFLPFVPFSMVNMCAGLTLVPISTFIVTTAVGMMPLVVMYALAGGQLQTISSPRDLFSWQMIAILATLAVLAIIPVILEKCAWCRDKTRC